jgi:hypothetical protein
MGRRPPSAEPKRDNTAHVPGAYALALRRACLDHCSDPIAWLVASETSELFAEHHREVSARADELFNQRVSDREPVTAWWHWLPNPLPPPLHQVGRTGWGPRIFVVTADDMIEPTPAHLVPAHPGRWQHTRA